MSIGGRIRLAISSKYNKLSDFSKESGIPYRTLYEYFNDERLPGSEVLLKLRLNLSISIDWLLTGEGEMYNQRIVDKAIDIIEIDKTLELLKPEQRQEILIRTKEMIRLNTLEEQMNALGTDKKRGK